MRHLYDPAAVAEVTARMQQLRPTSERQWGTMTAPQVLAHLAGGLEMALGDMRPPRVLAGRIFGWIIKPLALGAGSMRRNTPTIPELVIADVCDLDVERRRVSTLIDRFVAAGPAGCTTHPHSFFGRMTPQEWAVLMYKHMDHHLQQFGV